ncbi:hypothetical protein P879_12010, partial [Paragonimus westermani]
MGEKMTFLAEEISALILTELKEVAEGYLGKNVSDVAVTVPAYFDDSQRQATKGAETIAGMNFLHI